MRLIDADALIDKTDDRYSLHEIGRRERDDIVDALEYAPTIQSEPHWIPVTERLPKEDGSYLVSGKWGSGKESVGDCEFSVEDGYFQTAWNFDVLAWMPLPEPYKPTVPPECEGDCGWCKPTVIEKCKGVTE